MIPSGIHIITIVRTSQGFIKNGALEISRGRLPLPEFLPTRIFPALPEVKAETRIAVFY